MRRTRWTRLAWLLGTVALVFLVAGCGAKGTLGSLKERFGGQGGPVVEVPTNEAAPPELGGTDTRTVLLYFSDPKGQQLVAEERAIPRVEGIGRRTLEELVRGPAADSGLLPTIPAGTRLLDINIRPDGLARVDFSRELVENHRGGATAENLTVYSIVNTLTQFPTVDRVQILVEGKYVNTLAGVVNVSTALTRNENLIAH